MRDKTSWHQMRVWEITSDRLMIKSSLFMWNQSNLSFTHQWHHKQNMAVCESSLVFFLWTFALFLPLLSSIVRIFFHPFLVTVNPSDLWASTSDVFIWFPADHLEITWSEGSGMLCNVNETWVGGKVVNSVFNAFPPNERLTSKCSLSETGELSQAGTCCWAVSGEDVHKFNLAFCNQHLGLHGPKCSN